MELKIQKFNIRKIQPANRTAYKNGILSIHKKELAELISRDPRIKHVEIEVAQPGDQIRITNILEITEPRVKERQHPVYYPGMLEELYLAGEGTTNVLAGAAVFEIGSIPEFFGGLVDMAGEGARYTPFSKTHNVCIIMEPTPDVEAAEYGLALKKAGLRASVYLAKATSGMTPDEIEIFSLDGLRDRRGELPRIGYLFQLHSHGDSREPFIYGDNPRRYYPTILHPNEILDGAVVCGHYNISMALKNTTYSILNHPVIVGLYERHGRELDFCGVVAAPEPTSLKEIRRTATMSANLLKNILKVDGVIITKEGGGHTDVDIMQNCEECERRGIKTVIIDNEWLGPDGAGEVPLLAVSPHARAIVSVGNVDGTIDLPGMDEIFGGNAMTEIKGELKGAIKLPLRFVPNAISQLGLTYLTTEIR